MSKQDFAVLRDNPDLHYLDSAATALVPDVVVDAINSYYKEFPANIHRGLYDMSERATKAYEHARETVASFVGASSSEISFTSGTTAGINMLARSLESRVEKGDNIVVSIFEHHANFVPWQQLCARKGAEFRVIGLDMDASALIDERTKVVAVSMMSNVTGQKLPVEKWIAQGKAVGAFVVLDAAQAVVHGVVDVKKLGCDALVFSGHKLYGPTGVGVMYLSSSRSVSPQRPASSLRRQGSRPYQLQPSVYGGGMIRFVAIKETIWADAPARFEAGTPPIAQTLGLAAAIKWFQNQDLSEEKEVAAYLHEQLTVHTKLLQDEVTPVQSFTIDGIHPHDVAQVLADNGVAVRAGHHCAEPLTDALGQKASVRVSVGLYTYKEDIDTLIEGVKKAKQIFL